MWLVLRQWTNSRDRADAGADESEASSRIQRARERQEVRTREVEWRVVKVLEDRQTARVTPPDGTKC